VNISIFSFISAIVWSTTFVVITYFIRKNNSMKKYYGVGALFVLYIFCFVRIFLPIEFSFTKIIPAKNLYADIYREVHLDNIDNKVYILSLAILFLVWIGVAGIKITKFVVIYCKTYRSILMRADICEQKEVEILNSIKLKLNKDLKIDIYRSKEIDIPISMGLWKKSIVLPDKKLTDNELYYILIHEYTHFLNKDIIVKIMTKVFCDLFWWLPPIQLLKKDLEQLLEIKCDLRVTGKMNKKSKIEYLTVIVNILRNISNNQREIVIGATLVEAQKKSEITERFEVVMNYKASKSVKVVSFFIISIFLVLNILSYAYIVQPAYEAPEDNSKAITTEDAYIFKTLEGQYLLYMDGILVGEMSEENMKVFSEDNFKVIEEVVE